jgi:hypothetical protein
LFPSLANTVEVGKKEADHNAIINILFRFRIVQVLGIWKINTVIGSYT